MTRDIPILGEPTGSALPADPGHEGKGEIHLVHLYPREMSIYGDLGNTRCLAARIRRHGYVPVVHQHHPGEPFPERVDLVVGGRDDAPGERGVDGRHGGLARGDLGAGAGDRHPGEPAGHVERGDRLELDVVPAEGTKGGLAPFVGHGHEEEVGGQRSGDRGDDAVDRRPRAAPRPAGPAGPAPQRLVVVTVVGRGGGSQHQDVFDPLLGAQGLNHAIDKILRRLALAAGIYARGVRFRMEKVLVSIITHASFLSSRPPRWQRRWPNPLPYRLDNAPRAPYAMPSSPARRAAASCGR